MQGWWGVMTFVEMEINKKQDSCSGQGMILTFIYTHDQLAYNRNGKDFYYIHCTTSSVAMNGQ